MLRVNFTTNGSTGHYSCVSQGDAEEILNGARCEVKLAKTAVATMFPGFCRDRPMLSLGLGEPGTMVPCVFSAAVGSSGLDQASRQGQPSLAKNILPLLRRLGRPRSFDMPSIRIPCVFPEGVDSFQTVFFAGDPHDLHAASSNVMTLVCARACRQAGP
ncbi:hypothetical protein J7T55_013347 [Diaporthe amygdali]|uniref:uncharacterized protein n=1 Tax=Phomopsis amygdali TaxID=1214568 RepID=UPI0022FE6CD4|nr:uncharacterized protein J7T55_013347 [Diaporthe amygdali]KAJ0119112.1 hypothetical protein J7T55_013347 [Diaporthe amygdali]